VNGRGYPRPIEQPAAVLALDPAARGLKLDLTGIADALNAYRGGVTFDWASWSSAANIVWPGGRGAENALELRDDDTLVFSKSRRATEAKLFTDRDERANFAAVTLRRAGGATVRIDEPIRYFGATGGQLDLQSMQERVLHELGVSDVFPLSGPVGEADEPADDPMWLEALEHLRDARAEVANVLSGIEQTVASGSRPYGGQFWRLMSYCARFGYAVRSAELAQHEQKAETGVKLSRVGAEGGRKGSKKRREDAAKWKGHADKLFAKVQGPSTAASLAEYAHDYWFPAGPDIKEPKLGTLYKYAAQYYKKRNPE
jgi:hypothetical protein